MINEILQGDIREVVKTLPDESVNCIVTSPPYWGLRNYGMDDQIGLEDTPEAYVETMTAIFRELRRVLRSDGTCWLVLGDSYVNTKVGNTNGGESSGLKNDGRPESSRQQTNKKFANDMSTMEFRRSIPPTLKPKDLCLIPHRVALALQQDGWWVRQTIVWSKPNPMPESVTDRPTTAHEYIFLLTKAERYWYDAEAVREPHKDITIKRWGNGGEDTNNTKFNKISPNTAVGNLRNGSNPIHPLGRNRRSVWTVATTPYPESHFAVFPPALIRPCILAGCPAMTCEACGEPWERVVEKPDMANRPLRSNGSKHNTTDEIHISNNWGDYPKSSGQAYQKWRNENPNITLGFQPTCACNAGHVPGVVFDPFFGSGTVGQEAIETGRRWLGCELNPDYIELAKKRIYGSQPALFPAV